MILKKTDDVSAELVATLLQHGATAIIPTDTIYGFSGIVDIHSDARGQASDQTEKSYATDQKIRNIKDREEDKPFIQLIAKPEDIYLYTDAKIPDSLFSKWPGPLTIIVPIKKDSPYLNPKLYPTVAFRCPNDPWLRSVIAGARAPLFSTSVNKSGQPVFEEIEKIKDEFDNLVDIIVEDGDKKDGVPSTIVSILDGTLKVIREGAIKI